MSPISGRLIPPRPRLEAHGALAFTLLAGAAIAFVNPFDVGLSTLSAGSRIAQVALLVAIGAAGAYCAREVGFALPAHGTRHPWRVGLTAAAGVAGGIVLLDGVLARSLLPPSYVGLFLHTGLADRLIYFMMRAYNENILYRLFLFSALTLGLRRLSGRRSGPPPEPLVWTAMVLAQIINIAVNVVMIAPGTPSPETLAYDAVRYITPGVVWAWLFRRHGFATAEIASVCCHLFLQPALALVLRW